MKNIISRRSWLKEAGLFASGIFLQDTIKNLTGGTAKRDITILVVSGWQDINIGDIAHTPGLLHIFDTFLPEAKVILWKRSYIFFVPDATFFLNIKNEEKAISFLKETGLIEKEFICVVPRLRRTPYYKVNPANYTPDQVKAIDDLNNSKKEADHAKLREAMIAYVRKTGNKVLVCPEMTYQVDIMDELLIDPLPDDVKPFVKKRGYWFPDEAASVYTRAFTVLSFECHSPIIALRNNTPAFYLRQPEDTIKGQMYYDLGLKDWVFEIEQSSGKLITDRLMDISVDPANADQKLKEVKKMINDLFNKSIEILKTV